LPTNNISTFVQPQVSPTSINQHHQPQQLQQPPPVLPHHLPFPQPPQPQPQPQTQQPQLLPTNHTNNNNNFSSTLSSEFSFDTLHEGSQHLDPIFGDFSDSQLLGEPYSFDNFGDFNQIDTQISSWPLNQSSIQPPSINNSSSNIISNN